MTSNEDFVGLPLNFKPTSIPGTGQSTKRWWEALPWVWCVSLKRAPPVLKQHIKFETKVALEEKGWGGGLRVKWLIPPFAIICDITTYSVPPLYPKLDNPFLSITTKYQNLYYIFAIALWAELTSLSEVCSISSISCRCFCKIFCFSVMEDTVSETNKSCIDIIFLLSGLNSTV